MRDRFNLLIMLFMFAGMLIVVSEVYGFIKKGKKVNIEIEAYLIPLPKTLKSNEFMYITEREKYLIIGNSKFQENLKNRVEGIIPTVAPTDTITPTPSKPVEDFMML